MTSPASVSSSLRPALNLFFLSKSSTLAFFLMVEKPWSETTMTSVLSRIFLSRRALRTSSRFLSQLANAETATSEPGLFSCWEASGSLSQRRLYFGTPLAQRPWTKDLVVQASWKVFGCVTLVDHALSSLSL